jgi:hypothetical protein
MIDWMAARCRLQVTPSRACTEVGLGAAYKSYSTSLGAAYNGRASIAANDRGVGARCRLAVTSRACTEVGYGNDLAHVTWCSIQGLFPYDLVLHTKAARVMAVSHWPLTTSTITRDGA